MSGDGGMSMLYKAELFFFLVLFLAGAVFGDKKARVITESGKKWDVVFLRMSNDTIYLKARKPSGAFFSISGYKSKFKRVEFSDGSLLDFTVSNFPSAETQNKPRDIGDWSSSMDSSSRKPGSSGSSWEDIPIPEKNDSSASGPNAVYLAFESKHDSAAATSPSQSNLNVQKMQENGLEKTRDARENGDTAKETGLSIETKPSRALIEIDGKPIEGATPLVVRHLAAGKHTLRVHSGPLGNSMNVTLVPGKIGEVKLQLDKEQSGSVKKKHTVAFSLCMLSVAALAGSGASYYLFTDDRKKSEEAYESLQNASVLGTPSSNLLDVNKSKNGGAADKLKISQLLLGVAAAFLGVGIVLYF